MDAGCDAAPDLKKGSRGGGGGGVPILFFLLTKRFDQFYRHGVGVSSYMTNISDKQASKMNFKNGAGVFEPPITPPPPPPHSRLPELLR